jgi:hypothetical protein
MCIPIKRVSHASYVPGRTAAAKSKAGGVKPYQSRGKIQVGFAHSLSDTLATCGSGGEEASIAYVRAAAY